MSFADELRKNTKSQEDVLKEKQEAAEIKRKKDFENAKAKVMRECRKAADQGKRTATIYVDKLEVKSNFFVTRFDPDNYVRNIYKDVCKELGLRIKKFRFDSYDSGNCVIVKW